MIVSCGHTAYDNIFRLKVLPELNGSCVVDQFGRHFGGGGANVAVALAKLGLKVKLFSTAGEDFTGSEYEKSLIKSKVDIEHVTIADEKTAESWMYFDEMQRYKCFFYWGASRFLQYFKVPTDIRKHDFFFNALDPQFVRANIGLVKGKVAFDPSYDIYLYTKEDFAKILPRVDYLFLNEHEYPIVMKNSGLTKNKILRKVGTMVVSKGSAGCEVHTESHVRMVPTPPVDVVDTVGAGDAHRAGFMAGIEKGYSEVEAAKIGNFVASFSIQEFGAQARLPTWEEVEKLL
ncbi:MAG: carbohydrate kinase family protein [archaeon]